MINKRRAFITGIKGTNISQKEIIFLKKYKPWGIILFSRNIKTIHQTQQLTKNIRSIFKDENYPILIDEEGGRVSRLRKFIDSSLFSAKFFGELYLKNKKKFMIYYKVYINQITYLLNLLGINLNSVPVMDVYRKKSNKVIGNRSFSSNTRIVTTVGNLFIDQFHKNRIATIVKHIPGHGLSKFDSHFRLPSINASLKELYKKDFKAFENNKSLFSMTAHIIYKNIDSKYPATHSKKIINIIRNKIKFKSIIISDDISMKSLKFSIAENTKQAFTAGCNIVMHCNGNFSEMMNVAKNSPYVDKFILKNTYKFYNIVN